MTRKDLFIKALETLFDSWGGDTPAEVIWGCNELLEWYESEYNVKLGIRFEEEVGDSFNSTIEAIKNTVSE